MAEPYPYRSHVDQEDPAYAPLPGGAEEPKGRWAPAKAVILAGLSLLLVAGMMIGFSTDVRLDVCAQVDDGRWWTTCRGGAAGPRPIPAETMVGMAPRGVKEGVSAKSNQIFAGVNVRGFPWNNSMLSWQRTAFHFQPEKNWMNGDLFFFSFSISLSIYGVSFL